MPFGFRRYYKRFVCERGPLSYFPRKYMHFVCTHVQRLGKRVWLDVNSLRCKRDKLSGGIKRGWTQNVGAGLG